MFQLLEDACGVFWTSKLIFSHWRAACGSLDPGVEAARLYHWSSDWRNGVTEEQLAWFLGCFFKTASGVWLSCSLNCFFPQSPRTYCFVLLTLPTAWLSLSFSLWVKGNPSTTFPLLVATNLYWRNSVQSMLEWLQNPGWISSLAWCSVCNSCDGFKE